MTSAESGQETWVKLDGASTFVPGQKIDFGGTTGLSVTKADGKTQPLKGTYLVAETDVAGNRVRLMDSVDRRAVVSSGTFDEAKAEVSTYKLVGPQYFTFFAMVMAAVGTLFILFAAMYREKTHLRSETAES